MDGQRRLMITLAVEATVPPEGLDFNSLVAAFHRFGDLSTARLFEVVLDALEEELGRRLQAEGPDRYVWNGFHGKAKEWILPFGRVRHRYHRILDRARRRHVIPLREALAIPLRKRYSWAVLAGPVSLATELSFRRAAREGRNLQGVGPSKSTTYDYFQNLAGSGLDPLRPPEDRTLEVVIADGTKLKRQRRGFSDGQMDLRLVLSEKRDGGSLQVAAFDLEAEWPVLKARLLQAFPDEPVGALLHDGEESIDVLADPRTRVQRCLVHGPRGLRFALYQDGLKKKRQDPLLEKFFEARAWRMDAEALIELTDAGRFRLRGLLDNAKFVCEEMLELLPRGATHARAYLNGFLHNSLSYLRALLNGEPLLPGVTTNQIENVFSQMDLRLKEIGRRWGLTGATNMIRVLLTKIFRPEFWEEYLASLKGKPGGFVIHANIASVEWTS
ncbi:MAG: hypothetical protein L0Y78_09885 [candidate division NC10 bacterium]|nr:hypothetical protein [candidate division NC10 bacterium]